MASPKITLWDCILFFLLIVILSHFANKFVFAGDLKEYCERRWNEYREGVK